MTCKGAIGRLFALLATFVLLAGPALAAGIKVVPSTDRLSPGEAIAVDIVAEGIPAEGLGSVQFRLHVEAPGAVVAGVPDLGQASADSVSVAAPLLISAPTSARSGLGPFFLNGQGPSGILVLDNESFENGSALFTYAHTKGAVRSFGNGSVARFMIKVGERVEAEEIRITLSDVLLLDGGPEFPLDYNLGATLTLRCNATVPNLAGLSRAQAQEALAAAGLTLGSVYEIDNAGMSHPLDVVLEQSAPAGQQLLCESVVDLAINSAPADVTGLSAADKVNDDAGTVELFWSGSGDVAGYRVYEGAALLREVSNPQGAGAEISALANGTAHSLTVKAYDGHGNESVGVSVTATPIDDVFPVVTITGVTEGTFYNAPVNVQATATDTNLDHWSATLNGQPFDFAAIAEDGAYTLAVTAVDASDNRTEQSVSFIVDRTAPAITVANLVEGGHYNSDLTPQIAIDDVNLEAAATTYSLDGQSYLPGAVVEAEGLHALAIFARDKAGNSSSLTVRFVIDKTAPQIVLENVADGAFYNVDVTPAVAVTDAYLKASSITLNGEAFVSGAALTEEGEYHLAVSGEDEAGNSTSLIVNFVIDRTVPNISVDGVADGAFYNVDVTPAVAVTDAYLKTGSVTLNGEAFVSGTTLTEEGAYQLAVSGEDKAGNSASRTIDFVIDKTAPTITVEGVADGALYNADVTPAVTIADAYLKAGSLTLNGQPYVSATVVSEEGAYTLSASAEDRAGNRAEVSLGFVIDKTAPASAASVGTPRFTAGDRLFIAAGTEVSLSAVDGGAVPTGVAGIEYALDQTEQWVPYASPFALAGLPEGSHEVHFRAADQAGNLESAQRLPLLLDKSAPATALTVGNPQYRADGQRYVTGSAEFTLSAADALSGVAATEYRLDDGVWTVYTAAFTLAGLAEGEHTVGCRSTDNVTNVETEQVLTIVADNTAPATAIAVGDPQYAANGNLYVAGATGFTLSAADNLSGVARTEYRVDGGAWTAYAPFTLANLADGEHTVGYRSVDNVTNVETEQVLTVIVDNAAPATVIAVGTPQHAGADGTLYVTAATEFTLSAADNLSGVATTEYRLDGGAWTAYAPFRIPAEGDHFIEYRSADRIGNLEEARALSVTVDNTPPQTAINFNHQSYMDGETLLVSGNTEVSLTATDNLSGVQATWYRFDDEPSWHTYYGAFRLAGLDYGSHVVRFRSADQVENMETEKSVAVVLVAVEVRTELLNLPRVLVWTEDPAGTSGKSRPAYGLDDVRSLVEEALGVPDVYFVLVTGKEDFRKELRSGIYNMAMVLNQDVPFDTVFLREMKEAVNRGMGLLVSAWGNSVPPIWQDAFGVDFKGSLAMDEAQRPLHLFAGPVSSERTLTAVGRVLKTRLDGGVLAGLIPGESVCSGIRGLSLHYPAPLHPGDRVRAVLQAPRGKRLMTIDEEELIVETLPAPPVNRFTGNTAGDLAIADAAADGIFLTLSAPYGYLEESYTLSVTVVRPDGSTAAAGIVTLAPTCDANLHAGMNVGPFQVAQVEEDRVNSSEDVPAVVLNRYGKGRTAFLSYNLIESALHASRSEHLEVLRNAASYLLPAAAGPEPGAVALLETRIELHGSAMALKAEELLGEGLTHLPLFDLTTEPLAYIFRLEEGEEAAYRYFLRIGDDKRDFTKLTEVSLELDGGDSLFDRYPFTFATGSDSNELLQQALLWVDGRLKEHPEASDALGAIRDELVQIGCLPRTTATELDKAIHQVVQTLHHAGQLPVETAALRQILDEYLRILEGMAYFGP